MKTIIAGADFTPSSVNACKYAAMLAQRLNCKLVIFNMFEAPVIHSNVGLYGISYSSEKKTAGTKTARLTEEIQKLFPSLKISWFTTNRAFKDELETFIANHKVETAVMGLESKNRISRFIYGSHGVNIAGKIDCPVIIVPEKYRKHKLSEVVLAVDNNEKLLKSSLRKFEKFITHTSCNLSLLHIRTKDEIFEPKTQLLKMNGKNLPIGIIKSNDLQDGIKKYCLSIDTDMVALISKKHAPFYDLFSESNTKKVAFAARVPVMAIHE